MQFITAQVHGEEFTWLYVIEGPAKRGDIVLANLGGQRKFMEVKKVGTTRAAVKSTYDGPVKVIAAREPLKVANAVKKLARANGAVARARAELADARKAAYPAPSLTGMAKAIQKENEILFGKPRIRSNPGRLRYGG